MNECVLVVEDETKIAGLLCDYLAAAGYAAVAVHDGAAVLDAITSHNPDLILLDVMLPGLDGLTLCRQIRSASTLPVIMLTARGEEADRLLGLEIGADDYITKPFSPREVVARVRAVLRRTKTRTGAGGTAADGAFVIDETQMLVSLDGHRLTLTPVEFRLLSVLAHHPGRVYKRAELLDLIYDDYRDVSDRTIDSHIKNLRRKFAAIRPAQMVIHSVYSIGYKFDLE